MVWFTVAQNRMADSQIPNQLSRPGHVPTPTVHCNLFERLKIDSSLRVSVGAGGLAVRRRGRQRPVCHDREEQSPVFIKKRAARDGDLVSDSGSTWKRRSRL
jgi:hypothetical protein